MRIGSRRSRRFHMFFKIGAPQNFAIFTEKRLLDSLFNKVGCLHACNYIKKRLQHKCSTENIEKILRTAFFIKQLRWLLLKPHRKFLVLVLSNSGCFSLLFWLETDYQKKFTYAKVCEIPVV